MKKLIFIVSLILVSTALGKPEKKKIERKPQQLSQDVGSGEFFITKPLNFPGVHPKAFNIEFLNPNDGFLVKKYFESLLLDQNKQPINYSVKLSCRTETECSILFFPAEKIH